MHCFQLEIMVWRDCTCEWRELGERWLLEQPRQPYGSTWRGDGVPHNSIAWLLKGTTIRRRQTTKWSQRGRSNRGPESWACRGRSRGRRSPGTAYSRHSQAHKQGTHFHRLSSQCRPMTLRCSIMLGTLSVVLGTLITIKHVSYYYVLLIMKYSQSVITKHKVPESPWINPKCEECEKSGEEAETGPTSVPPFCQVFLLSWETDILPAVRTAAVPPCVDMARMVPANQPLPGPLQSTTTSFTSLIRKLHAQPLHWKPAKCQQS